MISQYGLVLGQVNNPWIVAVADRHGQSGAGLSEMLPQLAKAVDDVCILRSVHTDQFNHAPAQIFFNIGFAIFVEGVTPGITVSSKQSRS